MKAILTIKICASHEVDNDTTVMDDGIENLLSTIDGLVLHNTSFEVWDTDVEIIDT